MKRWLPLLLALTLPAHGEVLDNLRYRYYDAYAQAGDSLRAQLNAASPIRQNGQIFHGYTRWQVGWRFWWQEERDGRCRLTLSRTQLSSEITLPRLNSDDATLQQRFNTYQNALREHELGHYRIGQTAAAEIDARLLDTPEYPSCAELQRVANQRANAVLQRHLRSEQRYDRDTGHGRTQGAWLREP